jgi:hypothetical protein
MLMQTPDKAQKGDDPIIKDRFAQVQIGVKRIELEA